MAHRFRYLKPIANAAIVGAASGAASYVAYAVAFSGRNGYSSFLALWASFFGPGIIYGFVLCLYLVVVRRATLLRAAALVPLVTAVWYPTIKSTTIGPHLIGFPNAGLWLGGLFAGTVAVFGVVVAMCLLFRFYRRISVIAVTLLVGMTFGMLLDLPIGPNSIVLTFILWQAGVTACIGWGVARAAQDAAAAPTPAASYT